MWHKGPRNTEVVSDFLVADAVRGSGETQYYGGFNLVAESVAPSLVPLIVEAPAMFELLVRYVLNDPCAANDPRHIEALEIIGRIEPKFVTSMSSPTKESLTHE